MIDVKNGWRGENASICDRRYLPLHNECAIGEMPGKAIWRLCSVKPQRCKMGSEVLRHRSRQDHPIEHRQPPP